jgi:Flp pilus assembly pilin Flp
MRLFRHCEQSEAISWNKNVRFCAMRLLRFARNDRGQTSVEYLMLLGATFITAYVMITGPFATFTTGMIAQIKNVTGNVVRNGEISGKGMNPGTAGHPARPERLKPLHL